MRAIFITLFLLPFLGHAHDLKIPTKGTYNFTKEFEVLMKKRHETVYGFTQIGRERLTFLRNEGYTCSNTGREIFLCTIFLSEQGTENEVREIVMKRMQENSKIVFSDLRGEPSLISEGSALKIWQISQKVEFAGRSYSEYRYLRGDGFEKIFLGEPAEYSFEIMDNQLGFPLTFSETDSKDVYRRYLVLSFFRM